MNGILRFMNMIYFYLFQYFKLSVCQPDNCSANDFNAILGSVRELYNFTFPGLFYPNASCTTKESEDFAPEDYVTT